MPGHHRTFLVLVLATITSFVGKMSWDSKHSKDGAGPANNNNRKKGKGKKSKSRRSKSRRGGSGYDESSVGRREHYGPDEVGRCVSVFED